MNGEKLMNENFGWDALKLTIFKIFSSVIIMLNAMLLSRFRTLEEYGTYSQLILVINLSTTIFLIGLPNSINYFLSSFEDERDKKRFISLFYIIVTFVSVFIGVLLVILAPSVELYFKNPEIRGYLFFLLIYPWTKVIISTKDNALIVYGKITKLSIMKIVEASIIFLVIIISYFANLSFSYYLVLFLIGEVLFTLYVYYCVFKISGGFEFYFSY